MEKVLIDKFVVPEESRIEFLQTTRQIQSFLKTLPGFLEGFVYEKSDGDSRHNIMTTAVWENEEAYQSARRATVAELQRLGIAPQELMKNLKVEVDRAVYERSPY